MFLPSNITLKFGDSGDFVAELQRRLAMVHCFSNDQVNGFYDGATVNGVMQFQGSNGLHADGVAGPETLRRLNGVIAGDTSSATEDKKEEEQQIAARDAGLTNLMLAETQPAPNAWGEPAPREEAPAAHAPQPAGLDPAMFAPAAAMAAAQPSPADMADRAMREQNISQNPVQDLNNLLAQAQQHAAANPVPPARPPEPPPMPAPEPVYTAPQPLQYALQPPPPLQQPQPVAPPVVEPVATELQPQQGGGLMQRAGRFANAMMQKLSDYFEAKLPPSVMNEVKAAGAVMAAAGLREAPIPTGPEMGGPAQQIPARGPEQQPTQIR